MHLEEVAEDATKVELVKDATGEAEDGRQQAAQDLEKEADDTAKGGQNELEKACNNGVERGEKVKDDGEEDKDKRTEELEDGDAENLDNLLQSEKNLKDKLENGADDLVLLVADNLGGLSEKLDNVGDEGVDEADDDSNLGLDELDDVRLLLLDLASGGVVNGLVDGTAVLPDLNVGVLDLGVDDLSALGHLVGDIRDAGKSRENGNVGSGRGLDVFKGGKVVGVGNKTVNGVGGGRVGAGEEGGKGHEAEVKVLHYCGGEF